MKYVLTRDVTPWECPWLEETVPAGATVYRCAKATYGCIGGNGIAATFDENGGYPFFELPVDAIEATE